MRKIVFLSIILSVISCHKDQAKFKITDFTESKEVIVEPYKYYPYAMFNLKIKGYVNDTILIKTKGIYNLNMKLFGKIDTLWYSDYYGEGPMKFIFKPHKAREREIEIEITL